MWLCQACGYNSKQKKYSPYYCGAYGLQWYIIFIKYIMIYMELYCHKSHIGREPSPIEFYKVYSRYIFRIQRNHKEVRKQDLLMYMYIFIYFYLMFLFFN